MVTTTKIKETATTIEYHYYVENHKSNPADIGRIVFKKPVAQQLAAPKMTLEKFT
ncbi:hypothetical protein K1W63_08605 [Weissella cibaria]|uniref:hypothetical protein n=1 Tax=Weissella cibaria TaxID=137591 RepID=UPI0014307704|nr:hypothetical protein [Weissella cibaria]MBZ5942419.1 hypothetical protein [Weissella cibaria]MCB5826624.1 hypothetical protein [Weissella cibaria]MCB5858205.1 hypothetical protein [Weissella cibaria]MCB5860634.1 hypothetical protein [Weissella cibaria]MCB5862341.1 hypothetical protein [Weissella cibaria]